MPCSNNWQWVSTIDAKQGSKEARKQGRDVMTADIYPNTFVQAVINDKEMGYRLQSYHEDQRTFGWYVDLLLNIDSKTYYTGHVAYEGRSKVLYVKMNMALYGIIILLYFLLHYKKG